MQFMFLMYHYFSAHEVYNSIRVFITAYVWMTGFGNFSFFYLKADFGPVRVLQMLWRLNFLVTLLCMAMDNHYILYYICPLHTFYFLVVYAIMAASSMNYTKNGMRYKLLIAGAIIFCVWDWDLKIFEKFFWFLGRKSVTGASFGTMWEWYFRTSLDHWSTFLGMIFALNYPATAQWMKKVESMPPGRQWAIKGFVSVVLLSVTAWWAAEILPLTKLVYNQKNAYFGVAVPVLTYIYVRNLSPTLRTRYLEPLHSLGKITLETYLMQHHVWLTSNAKTLLVLVPGHPKVNMVLLSVTYVLVSRELYRLTMSLRGMCLPDNLSACLRNLTGIAVALASSVGVAKALILVGAGPVTCGCVIAAIGFGAAFAVHRLLLLPSARDGGSSGGSIGGGCGGALSAAAVTGTGVGADLAVKNSPAERKYDGRLLHANHTVPMLAIVAMTLAGASLIANSTLAGSRVRPGPYTFSTDACVDLANEGMWKVESGECHDPMEASAYCNSQEWKWVGVNDHCHLHYMPPSEVKEVLKAGRHIIVVGDSIERFVYYALIRSLAEPTPNAHNTSVEKHADFSWEASDGSGTRFEFLWAPLAHDLTNRVSTVYDGELPDVLMMGGGLWDALYSRDVEEYMEATSSLQDVVNGDHGVDQPAKMWVTMTNVVTDRLATEEKKTWLTEQNLAAYRGVLESSGLLQDVDGVIDGIKLTTGQRRESYDGVHYSDLTYDAFAQVAVNLVAHLENTGTIGAARVTPTPSAKPFVKEIVGMGSVLLGLVVVFLASVMVLSRDAYHGIARLAITCLGGRHVDRGSLTWEATYGELLRKLGKHPDRHKTLSMAAGGARERARSSTGGGGVEDDDGEAEKGLLDEGEGEGTAGRGDPPSTKHLP
ncbi:unnamed protein product [Ascophyllum nodosum]